MKPEMRSSLLQHASALSNGWAVGGDFVPASMTSTQEPLAQAKSEYVSVTRGSKMVQRGKVLATKYMFSGEHSLVVGV